MSDSSLFDQIMIELAKKLEASDVFDQNLANQVMDLLNQPKVNLEALTKLVENTSQNGASNENS